MDKVFETRHGKVVIGKSDYCMLLHRKAVPLTLIKPENEAEGWGVSKSYPEPVEITVDLIINFSEEAAKVM